MKGPKHHSKLSNNNLCGQNIKMKDKSRKQPKKQAHIGYPTEEYFKAKGSYGTWIKGGKNTDPTLK